MGYNRYMRGMSNGGAVQGWNGEPVTLDQMRHHVPSIFATEAHESRSDRFTPIPTATVIEGLSREGFDPFFAQQARTRVPGKAEFTKHMIRLRHRSMTRANGESFEIILLNANDGTSAYQMIPGFFRFVCTNGLFTGETFEQVKVRHSGDAVSEVIEGAYKVLDAAPDVCAQVDAFKALTLSTDERQAFAEAAHFLRFPKAYEGDGEVADRAPITAEMLLSARRSEDRAPDLWATFNRVQENAMRGGQSGWTRSATGRRRRATVREVTGVDQSRTLNRALWTLAERMAELKAA